MNKKESTLIVDDNVSLCKTLPFIFRCKGLNITFARDGIEAIDKVNHQKVWEN